MTEKDLINTTFDLEQAILGCWAMTNDIKELAEDVESGLMTSTQAVTMMQSYAVVYENRFERTWRQFEQVTSGIRLLRTGQLHRELTLDPLLDGTVLKTTPSKSGKKIAKTVDN
jgi:phage gpG-like protein